MIEYFLFELYPIVGMQKNMLDSGDGTESQAPKPCAEIFAASPEFSKAVAPSLVSEPPNLPDKFAIVQNPPITIPILTQTNPKF